MSQPAISGPQIRIVTSGTGDGVYRTQHPEIAGLPDGGFIAVWQQFHETTSPFDATSIQGQIYNADGTARGGQFQIDAPIYDYGDLDVYHPTVAVLADGKVLVAWEQRLHTLTSMDDASDIRARSIDITPTGPNLGAVFDLVHKDGDDRAPRLAALENGQYLISYNRSMIESSGYPTDRALWLSDYDAAGLVGGGWVYVDSALDQFSPDQSGTSLQATLMYRDRSGWLIDKTITVPTEFTGNQEAPSVIGLSNGNFVVVWQHNDPATGDGSGSSIKARIFKVDKSRLGNLQIDAIPISGEIIVNSTTAGHQAKPVVEALPNGGFVVAFQDIKGIYDTDIRVATFNAQGGRTGDDFLVGAETVGQQINPSITTLKDGRFVITWQDVGSSVRAQIFGTATNPDPDPNPNPDPDPIPDPIPVEQTVSGGAGDDVLDGTRATGLFDGREGFDTVTYAGSQGHVVVFIDPAHAGFNQGDAARDRFTSIESFVGTDYNDQFFGDGGNNRIDGGRGDDILMGGEGDDYLIGGDGDDTLDGQGGADTLDGGAGNNTFITDSQDTIIRAEGIGVQTVQANASYRLSASSRIDILKAGADAGAVNLTGNGLKNTIIGNASKNTLKGQGGNDTVSGGAGKDVLSGGTGKDVFVFDAKAVRNNHDRITDFSAKDDSLWLENGIFTKLGKAGTEAKPAKLKKSFFVTADKAQDANDYLIYNRQTGVLSYDADGSGKGRAVEIATFSNKPNLTHRDFFVI